MIPIYSALYQCMVLFDWVAYKRMNWIEALAKSHVSVLLLFQQERGQYICVDNISLSTRVVTVSWCLNSRNRKDSPFVGNV